MDELTTASVELVDVVNAWDFLRAFLLIAGGLLLARVLNRGVLGLFTDHLERHAVHLLSRVIFYGVVALFVGLALNQIGFHLSGLLGAAGILTVAVGFASQTAASNLVSGFFLIIASPFSVGDVIRIGSTTGEVISIDLLSTTLRTFDNLAVRIPNETLLKSEVTNLARFPIRRYDLQIGVAYKEDLRRVEAVLHRVAEQNKLCLVEPKPLLIVQGFGDSSLDLQYSVWGLSKSYLLLRNSIIRDVKEAFDAEGIEIPFPHRSLYAGSATDPIPVRVSSEPSDKAEESG